jgi:hypothetical protein
VVVELVPKERKRKVKISLHDINKQNSKRNEIVTLERIPKRKYQNTQKIEAHRPTTT